MGQTVSIIQQFLHPPVGLLVREHIPGGPFTGLHAFDRPRGPTRVDAFGIRWLITAFPAGYGVTPTAGQNRFDRDVMNIAVRHQLLDGEIIVTEEVFMRSATGELLFAESFPFIVDIEGAPGITYDVWWLLVL